MSLNNNPTVQDLWNTTPAFGLPYATSAISAGFGSKAQIDGSLGQDVAGLSVYLSWNESLYAELGLYRTARQGAGALDSTAGDNVLSGTAPYWRLAYEHNWGRHLLEGGLYGATFKIFPTSAAGQPLGGPTNQFKDVAEDVQYQYGGDQHLFSVEATRIHENRTLDAAFATGKALNGQDDLTTIRGFATYYYKRKIGGTLGFFRTTGSSDAAFVGTTNGLPDTKGWIAEVNYVPWLNTKFSVQYTAYNKYAGASDNYDGAGRNASDNNTLYIPAWLSY